MKVQELIDQLEKAKKQYGNLPITAIIYVQDGYDDKGYYNIREVTYWKGNPAEFEEDIEVIMLS